MFCIKISENIQNAYNRMGSENPQDFLPALSPGNRALKTLGEKKPKSESTSILYNVPYSRTLLFKKIQIYFLKDPDDK